MKQAFLPIDGLYWLCNVVGNQVSPLAVAPGMSDARWRFSKDGSEFALLDQGSKRVGHYRVLTESPWFENVRPPTTLPKGCLAHAILAHDGMLIVGGHSDRGEALWWRQDGGQPDWLPVALPEGLAKRRGKAIDALFVRGQELVAIDDILMPKWALAYPLTPVPQERGVKKFSLPSHTTYETIRNAAEGPGIYALHSVGYNHDEISFFLSIISGEDFRELSCWRGTSEPSTQQLVDAAYLELTMGDDGLLTEVGEPSALDWVNATLKAWSQRRRRFRSHDGHILGAITEMVFCNNVLVLALGKQGLAVCSPIHAHRRMDESSVVDSQSIRSVAMADLTEVHRLHCVSGEVAGVFAIGTDGQSKLAYEWIPADKLCGSAADPVSLPNRA